MNLQVVHLRVNDPQGQPTPIRLRVVSESGTYYPPLGRPGRIMPHQQGASGGNLLLDNDLHTYIDGTCEILLPAGDLVFHMSKGPNFSPRKDVVHRRAGQLSMRFVMEPRASLAEEGWYAGDTSTFHLAPRAAAMEGAAEGLAFVHVHALQDDEGQFWLMDDYSAQAQAASLADCQVMVGTRNQGGELGDLSLLYTHRVVFPLRLDQAGFEHYTLGDWTHQAHRKRGLVIWPEFRGVLREDAVALVLGEIDAVEWSGAVPWTASTLEAWYHLLNAGCRVPLVGGSGKRDARVPVGAVRTYAHLGWDQPFSIPAWIEAVRGGKTAASRGALLYFAVGDRQVGEEVMLDEAKPTLPLKASLQASDDVARIELLVNGRVVAEQAKAVDGHWSLESMHACAPGNWLAARAWTGKGNLYAHTSPIYIGPKAEAKWGRPSIEWLLRQCHDLRPLYGKSGRNEAQRATLFHHLEEAEQLLEKRLQRCGANGGPSL